MVGPAAAAPRTRCATMRAMAKPVPRLAADEIARIIATAWDDKPPFDRVLQQHGLNPGQLVQLLKRELTPNAYKVWTARTKARPGR